MSNITCSFKAPSWRKFLMENKSLNYSDNLLPQLRTTGSPGSSPFEIFETLSKNPGIGLLCLDADDETIMILHNPAIIGGSWLQSEKKTVALSGFDSRATAIHLKERSILDIRQKVPKWIDIQEPIYKDKKEKRNCFSTKTSFLLQTCWYNLS